MVALLKRGHAKRKHSKAELVTVIIDADVTPVNECGEVVICDIEPTAGSGGGYVKDGVIFLVDGQDYQLNLHLANSPTLGQFSWDADPFWAKKAKCPDKSGMPNGQFPSQPTVAGTTLTVGAKGVPGKSAVHFRLNMLDVAGNPVFCDPIIINN